MKTKKVLQESSVGMAVLDLFPVLFFAGSVLLVALLFDSIWFRIGAAACIAAGLAKVLWKLLLAVTKKNYLVLNRVFRPLMIGGAVLILVSCIVSRRAISAEWLWRNVSSFPCSIIFAAGIALMILMSVLAAKVDLSTPKGNYIEQTVNFFAQLMFFFGIAVIWYGEGYYPAQEPALDAMLSDETVQVTKIDDGYFFDGPGTDTAIAFYPGALVDCRAYAGMMRSLAEAEIDCFLLDVNYHLSIMDGNRAEQVMREYAYGHWYTAGHSMGGLSAASCAKKNSDRVEGVIFIGSYPNGSIRGEPLRVLSVFADGDGLVTQKRREANRDKLPEDAETLIIEGGNHAGFGFYGDQKGDGTATISPQEQQKLTTEAILTFVGNGSLPVG